MAHGDGAKGWVWMDLCLAILLVFIIYNRVTPWNHEILHNYVGLRGPIPPDTFLGTPVAQKIHCPVTGGHQSHSRFKATGAVADFAQAGPAKANAEDPRDGKPQAEVVFGAFRQKG